MARFETGFRIPQWYPSWNMRFDPVDGPPGGGGSDETFTKQQLEQIVQGRVAKLKEENDTLKKNQASLDARLKELENKPNNPPPNNPPPHAPPDDDLKGRLKLLENQHKSEVEGIKAKLDAETKKREVAEKRRKEVERDSLIREGLRLAGCRADAEAMGASHFVGQVELNEEEEKWQFRLKDGGTVTIAEGIKAELPDYMKEPSITGGGSGSRGGSAKLEGKKSQLQAAKDKLNKLKEASDGGNEASLTLYMQQKRIVQSLEKELSA